MYGAGPAPPWAGLYVPAKLTLEGLDDFCELLTRENVRFLRESHAPALYQSGAFYRQQPEYWLAIPHAILSVQVGMGLDCKTLSAWRAAELRVRGGEPGARCVVSAHPTPERIVYHVQVRRQDGHIEDPSAILGMNSALSPASYPSRGPYYLVA
jgi:hypothetical protein